jgi:hypothetical protein
MNKRQIFASLNKIANELDTNGLYNEANTVTKVMSRLAMDEDDEYNEDEYFPDDERYFMHEDEDKEYEPSMRQELDSDLMEVSDMFNPMGTSNPADSLLSHHAKDYKNPGLTDIENVFDELDSMLDDAMLSPKDQKRYEEIKRQLMKSYSPSN